MNRFIYIAFLLVVGLNLSAQRNHYIFIQTETPQDFFVKKDNRVMNSSPGGYIIISNLVNGVHEFSIGINGQAEQEKFFSIDLKGRDRSLLLKSFGEKGWGLYDLQDMSIAYAKQTTPGFQLKPEEEVSRFTNVLAQASGDSTLLYTVNKTTPVNNKPVEQPKTEITKPQQVTEPVVVNEETKKEETIKKNEQASVSTKPAVDTLTDNVIATDQKSTSQQVSETYQPSKVAKISENSTEIGYGIVYSDKHANEKADTVRILIENQSAENLPVKKEDRVVKQEEKIVQQKPAQNNAAGNVRFLDISTDKDSTKKEAEVTMPVTAAKNNCTSIASEKEITKIRNSMALAVTDETMITEAEKLFSQKCFTTGQVKRLSELFFTNAGKYSFFKAVYPYLSDRQYFYTLQQELKDEHYRNRFLDIMQTQ